MSEISRANRRYEMFLGLDEQGRPLNQSAPAPEGEPISCERRWRSLALWAAQETLGGARATGESVLARMAAIERGDPDTLIPASWAAPSPVTAAGEEDGPHARTLRQVVDDVLDGYDFELGEPWEPASIESLATELARAVEGARRAPAPTSAVPGLREDIRSRLVTFLAIVGASRPDDHPWVIEARTLADLVCGVVSPPPPEDS